MNEWSIAGAVQIYQKPACGINYFLSAVLVKGNSIVICSDGGWDLLENMLVGSIFGHPSACNVKPNQTYFQHQEHNHLSTAEVQLTHVIHRSSCTAWLGKPGLPNPIVVCTNERTCSLSSVIAMLSYVLFYWSKPHVALVILAVMRGWVSSLYFLQMLLISGYVLI